jgi:hypothetical protein
LKRPDGFVENVKIGFDQTPAENQWMEDRSSNCSHDVNSFTLPNLTISTSPEDSGRFNEARKGRFNDFKG